MLWTASVNVSLHEGDLLNVFVPDTTPAVYPSLSLKRTPIHLCTRLHKVIHTRSVSTQLPSPKLLAVAKMLCLQPELLWQKKKKKKKNFLFGHCFPLATVSFLKELQKSEVCTSTFSPSSLPNAAASQSREEKSVQNWVGFHLNPLVQRKKGKHFNTECFTV